MMIKQSKITLAAGLILALALVGCGGDDSTNPGGGGTSDTFDQATAVGQSQVAAPQAVALVESMDGLVGGVGLLKTGNYNWDAGSQRWVWEYDWNQSGYTWSWIYTTQYLDGSGNPQQEAVGASGVNHTMNGTGDYSQNVSGFQIDYTYDYNYDTSFTGLGTNTVTMTGTGGIDLDYTYVGSGVNQSSNYVMNWATVGNGISWVDDGCPTGTIRYDMNPYTLDVVFNGSSTAVSTLYDGSNNAVAGGGSTHPMSCVAK